jgi:hypothetical protein
MASKIQRFRELIEADEILIRMKHVLAVLVPFLVTNEPMGFATIRDAEQHLLTTAERDAKYGVAP